MCTRKPTILAILLLAPLAGGLSGCMAARNAFAPVADIAPLRQKRSAEAKRHLNESKDRAEYQAAHSLWQDGDIAGCRELLSGLLARNPTHRDGCLLWAEVSILYDEPEAAIKPLEELALAQPKDAEVKEALRLLKDAAEWREADVATSLQASYSSAPAAEAEQQDGAQHIPTEWIDEGPNGSLAAVCPDADCSHCPSTPVFDGVSPDEAAYPPERAIPGSRAPRPPVRLPETTEARHIEKVQQEAALGPSQVETLPPEETAEEPSVQGEDATTAAGEVSLKFVTSDHEQGDATADEYSQADPSE